MTPLTLNPASEDRKQLSIPVHNYQGLLSYDNFKVSGNPGTSPETLTKARELYFNRDRLLPF